ncbi:MAG TPA: VWA domain-containing protein [Candidatus Acidoferrales bacterium]|nr:VWA domain-containing protein [Candidatus Acidoferrales bacterium]
MHVERVNVEVTVTDAQGNFVSNLRRENFRVLDEGREQPVTNFSSIEAPAQVLVLVETSPAVYLIHRQHLHAAYALLEGLAEDDRVALATYDGTARLVLGFTANKQEVAQALGALDYNLGTGQLNLFEALCATIEWLKPLSGKKAIVLLTTGLDTSGSSRRDKLLHELRATDAVVLPIALGGELRQPDAKKSKTKRAPAVRTAEEPELSFQEADRTLKTIAETSGGHAYFPRDARDFTRIYQQISALLRHQYSLGFPPLIHDARYHKVQVQVLDAQGRVIGPAEAVSPADAAAAYGVRSRPGYMAPGP